MGASFRNQPQESSGNSQPSVEPHAARRAVRYAAASNVHQAMLRQFPGLFMSLTPLVQTAVAAQTKQDGADGDGATA